ncbi:MAG TPA: hypothetical protein VKT82_08650, partial [Ktedonobacterales bacterium]|nr:hypothetical protein [Ktedonobacterales bacterium]
MASKATNPHEQERATTDHPSSAEETASSSSPRYQHPFPFTIVPNCFLDEYLPRLSPTAQSVMLVFYRLTLGWHRSNTFISLSELRQRTGIASDATLTRALKELLAVGLISVSEQRGVRGLKGYGLTPAALSSTNSVELSSAQHTASDDQLPSTTESVELHQGQTPHNVQKLHIASEHPTPSTTESVEEPLQKLKAYPYRNCRSTSTDSVGVNASQPAQGGAQQEPKERVKKSKEIAKEIVRYDRSLELQNEMQKESKNTNTCPVPDRIDREIREAKTQKGAGHDGRQTQTVFRRVQAESRAGEPATGH